MSGVAFDETREMLCAPILQRGRVHAVLQMVSARGARHSHQDLCVAKLLSACTQAALEPSAGVQV